MSTALSLTFEVSGEYLTELSRSMYAEEFRPDRALTIAAGIEVGNDERYLERMGWIWNHSAPTWPSKESIRWCTPYLIIT